MQTLYQGRDRPGEASRQQLRGGRGRTQLLHSMGSESGQEGASSSMWKSMTGSLRQG